MRIEKMGSKTDLVVKLVLVFFISVLSFSIGTFVGKKYSDNQHELALLEPNKEIKGEAQREVASVDEEKSADESNNGKVNATMSDEEIAKLAEEFVADETEAPEKGEKAEAATETKTVENKATTETVAKNEPSHVAQQMAANEKPVANKVEKKAAAVKAERVPSSLPKNVAQYTVGKFTVQVASYADEGEAQKMASNLKQKGYSAFYIPAVIKGKTWFRVSVGQFATQKEALSYRTELMSQAKVGSAIVQKITE
jgi:cell division protein FtsN